MALYRAGQAHAERPGGELQRPTPRREHLFSSLRHARQLIAAWRDDYTQHRPHTSLDGLTPREYRNRSEVDQPQNRANFSTRTIRGAGHDPRLPAFSTKLRTNPVFNEGIETEAPHFSCDGKTMLVRQRLRGGPQICEESFCLRANICGSQPGLCGVCGVQRREDRLAHIKSLSHHIKMWCCRRDSNSRPLPYQGSALPLSYGSTVPSSAPGYRHRAGRRGGGYEQKPVDASAIWTGSEGCVRTARMTRKAGAEQPQPKASAARDERLKAALKANIARRKTQAKARKEQGRD